MVTITTIQWPGRHYSMGGSALMLIILAAHRCAVRHRSKVTHKFGNKRLYNSTSDQVLPEISRCTVSWHWGRSKATLAMLLLIPEERDFKLYLQVFSEDVQLMVFQTKEKINQIRLIRKQDETVVQKITYYIPAGT